MNKWMRASAGLAIAAALGWTAPTVRGQSGNVLPLHTQRLSERVFIAWVGDAMQTIRVIALKTVRGIVVIEANLMRSTDVRIRQAIEKEFGRKDIKYLINTHFHHDHTGGNQVYADTAIIGHLSIPEAMKDELTGEGLAKRIEQFKSMALDWAARRDKAAPDSRDRLYFQEGVILLNTTIGELQTGFVPTFPTILFDDRLTLDMGDVTIEIYSVGGTHTPSDIMIFVPQEGLAAIGDMWSERVLPYLSKGGPWDLERILANWGRIVESGREIKHVNFAHSDRKIGVEAFKEQYRYLKTLWNGLRDLRRRGGSLEDAKARYSIEKDFPFFKDRVLKMRDIDIHPNNVEAIWEKLAADEKS